ncbi:MlaE family lipid ABC transporter permease subunit [Fodinicurvata sediminis]|uniref:MlaE family lipid ABC transporter permease subunit n=1 Tax=Fodinicurvata sediminis TaxID=1121832 RepID=UPI0003B5997B|nr:MlaE family lipid ABC transporter permease subunit [Fodinicurvata sediminis]
MISRASSRPPELLEAGLTRRSEANWLAIELSGAWITETVAAREKDISALVTSHDIRASQQVVLDLSEVDALDTAGAWIVQRTAERLRERGFQVEIAGIEGARVELMEAVSKASEPEQPAPGPGGLAGLVESLGRGTVALGRDARDLVAFLGLCVVATGRSLIHPKRLRIVSLVNQIDQTGFRALPIVGLLAFLIGVVVSYQGAGQLARFGAQIFTVNLLGVSVLREMGILITAIIVAGRSGSAFTAQIGTMKVNKEVDAMRTIGLDPVEILVLPRILALVLVLPLLTVYANFMALLGGAIMSMVQLDIDPSQFISQLHDAVTVWSLWVGVIKAPVFAFVIALVGCYEGLRVGGDAESVGRQTTRAVVEAIFLVIVLDAFFSIFFTMIGV